MEKVYEEAEIGQVAAWLWQHAATRKLVALHGAMGAGKTTLVHALCEYLGVKDAVSSPTFSIINEYIFEEQGKPQSIFHIDLYRLKDEEEAIRAGVEDCLCSGTYCFVEWPEKAAGLLPAHTLQVFLTLCGDQKRKIKIAGN